MSDCRQEINDLYNEGDWKAALEIHNNNCDNYCHSLLWIQPAIEDLEFISNAVTSRGLRSLTSIGCGSGFLEWLIQSATGLQVKGVEVNPEWWKSPYTKTYLPHIYPEEEECSQIFQDHETAIMFCYFNNGPAFNEYLRQYHGNCLIIIGPKSDRHTNPHPFHPSFEKDDWVLKEFKQINKSIDYIVVYEKHI